LGRPIKGPRIYRRDGRPLWYAYLRRDRQHISLKTADESVARQRLLELVENEREHPSDYARPGDRPSYRKLAAKPVVYFIQDGIGGPIKIGRTDCLRTRLNTLQSAHARKLIVLGLLEDWRGLEEQMHALFTKERMGGEWFRPSLELLKFISTNTTRPR